MNNLNSLDILLEISKYLSYSDYFNFIHLNKHFNKLKNFNKLAVNIHNKNYLLNNYKIFNVSNDKDELEDKLKIEYKGYETYSFVMFSEDWCHFCIMCEPEFRKLINIELFEKLLNKNKILNIIVSKNNSDEINKYDIKGYPTFILFKGEDKISNFGDNDRRLDNFKKFINNSIN